MTGTQLDLFKRRAAMSGSAACHEMTERMACYPDRWITRSQLLHDCGLTDRECRAGRAASDGAIIFGQRGFKLAAFCTADEVDECLTTLRSQIKELQEQHRKIARRAHRALTAEGRTEQGE